MTDCNPYRWLSVLLATPVALLGATPAFAQQGYVLDGFGGVHAVNGAPVIAPATPYFGFDAAEAIEVMAGGSGYYVLDAYGGLHAGGTAPAPTAAPPYFGFDIARDISLVPESGGLDHRVMQASGSSLPITDTTFAEFHKITVTLPKKCSGSAPFEQWNILASASGYLLGGVGAEDGRVALSLDATTRVPSTDIGADTDAAAGIIRNPYHTQHLFTGVSSGTHDVRSLIRAVTGTPEFVNATLIVQVMGYTCSSSPLPPPASPQQPSMDPEASGGIGGSS